VIIRQLLVFRDRFRGEGEGRSSFAATQQYAVYGAPRRCQAFFVAMQRKPVDGESQTRRIVKAEKAIRRTKATDHRETGSRFDGKFLN
jgi:hypothetical protein